VHDAKVTVDSSWPSWKQSAATEQLRRTMSRQQPSVSYTSGDRASSFSLRAFSLGLPTGTLEAGLKVKPLVPALLRAGTRGPPCVRLRAFSGTGHLVPVCNTDRD
jgi:hypothetical protein